MGQMVQNRANVLSGSQSEVAAGRAAFGGKWEAEVFSIGIYVPQMDYMEVIEAGSVDLPPSSFAHKLILGRPFLRDFRLSYDGTTGVVTLSKKDGSS